LGYEDVHAYLRNGSLQQASIGAGR